MFGSRMSVPNCRSLLALALLPLSAGQGVAPLLKAIEGNNPSQINMALKSTHPKLLKEVDGSGASPRRNVGMHGAASKGACGPVASVTSRSWHLGCRSPG